MLRVMIPVISKDGATRAARHAVFLFAEHCVAAVEIVEVLEPLDQGRVNAFHSPVAMRMQTKRAMLSALNETRAILDDGGVPYHWLRVFGPVAQTIAACAAAKQSDIVLMDTSQLSFLSRWWVVAKLLHTVRTPVTIIH